MADEEMELYSDTLKELCTMGSGSAASSLSKMLDRKVFVKVPRAYIATSEEEIRPLFQGEGAMIVFEVTFLFDEKSENGKIFLFISEESARTITSFMLNKSFDFGEIGEIEESLITETANIVASTLITPVGNFLGRKIDISPPNLTVDVASAAVGSILAQQLAKTGHYFFVQTEVIASDISFSMELLLFPYFDLVKEVWKKMNI